MQPIHHQHNKKAERLGVQLKLEEDKNRIAAFWPHRNLTVYGQDARWALEQMQNAQNLIKHMEETSDIRIINDPATPWSVFLNVDGAQTSVSKTPTSWWIDKDRIGEFLPETPPMQEPYDKAVDPEPPIKSGPEFAEDAPHTIEGVPTNGRDAHRKGFTILDCPFSSVDPEAEERWSEEWEASAEEADQAVNEAEAEEAKTGSVVKTKYRAIYAERGHPTHCGDDLAVKLNNLVLTGSHADMDAFKAIMDANDIDMSKYNTTNNGWQGRYRMTGRNKLAKKVHSAGGILKLPNGEEMRMSQEWMQAQRFK